MEQQAQPRFQKKRDLTYGGQYEYDKAVKAMKDFMDAFGLDPNHPDFQDGQHRIVRMFAELWCGLFTGPPRITVFPNEIGDQLILLRGIDFVSTCSHHLVPFVGVAHVGYVPKNHIVGISKLARVVDYWAARPQVQERLTHQVAKALMDCLNPKGVAVWMEASHSCIVCRGAKKPNSMLVTSAWTGCFNERSWKDDFLHAIKGGNER